MTAWHALFRSGGLKPGESVLLQGTGGVSIFALQFAKMAGARVIATSSSDAKLERLRLMGADAVINYKTTPEWDKPVRELTERRRAWITWSRSAAPERCRLSSKAVRRGGHIALIGVLAGRGEFDPRLMMLKAARLQGIYVGSREMFEEMNRAISLAGHAAGDRSGVRIRRAAARPCSIWKAARISGRSASASERAASS